MIWERFGPPHPNLSPCPFCGSKRLDFGGGEWKGQDGVYIRCERCTAGGPTRHTFRKAGEAWNRRKVLMGRDAP